MLRRSLNEWLDRGTASQRFFKRFLFNFAIMMFVFTALHFICRPFHWKFFEGRPFVSEEFWVDCVCFGFGFAITDVTSQSSPKDRSTL